MAVNKDGLTAYVSQNQSDLILNKAIKLRH